MSIIIILLTVIAMALVLLLWAYNSLVRLRNKVNEAYSTMDVCLKKRFDLIPSLVEVVKAYAGHESEVLQQVASRRRSINASDRERRFTTETGISEALKAVFVVAEAYPDLKASMNFLSLQEKLVAMEDEISLSRRYYNGSVREYNNQCQLFPLSIVASLFGFKPAPMFAVGSSEERKTPGVVFALLMTVLTMATLPAHADRGGFHYERVHVDAVVHSNNTWDVTETFVLDFTEARHGFYRYIPRSFTIYHDVASPDGKTQPKARQDLQRFDYESRVKDISVDGWKYTTQDSDDEFTIIRIGDEKRTVEGSQRYVIKYKYIYGDDRRPGYDYLYHTILGTDFEQPIDHFSFDIKFDKPLPANISQRLKVFAGQYGNSDGVADDLEIEATRTMIRGKADNVKPLHGVTLYALLPQGYYEGVSSVSHFLTYLCLALFFITALLLAWRLAVLPRHRVTKVIEFYPPEDISSAEVGTIIDTTVDTVDIASLIPWLAGKGYLKIREVTSGRIFKSHDLELTKLADLPGNAPAYLRDTMQLFFGSGDVVMMKDIGRQPNLIDGISKRIKSKFTGEKQLTRINWWVLLYIPLFVFGTLALALNSPIRLFHEMACFIAAFTFAMPLGTAVVWRFAESGKDMVRSKLRRWGATIVIVLLSVLMCALFCFIGIDYGSPLGTVSVVVVFAVTTLLVLLVGWFRVDTEYRTQMMGRLLGFREFIETAEKPYLEQLQADDPAYFYKVLPYAMVFGLSDLWADHFKGISLEQPDWYESSTPLMNHMMANNLCHGLCDMTDSAISTISHSESSGGSGGGGFSGGGGGGGGGGSW